MRLTPPQLSSSMQLCKSIVAASLCSFSLLTSPPALALPPTLDDAIVEASDATYPILRGLEPQAFRSWTERLGKLVVDIQPDKLGLSIELAIDVFNSVPPEKVAAFNGVIKDAFADLKTESCTLVPLPSRNAADGFRTVAVRSVDKAKLSTFSETWTPSINALPKTNDAICLPTKSSLRELAMAQAEIGRSFDYQSTRRFFEYTVPLLKSEIRLTDEVLALAAGAKAQVDDLDATRQEKLNFQQAGKKLESAAKREKEKVAMARYKADVAAQAAAKKVAAAASK